MYDSFKIDEILSSNDREATEAIISFSRYLAGNPLNSSTVPLFTRILAKNIPQAADILFSERDPSSFFSAIPLSFELISFALSTLGEYRFSELHSPIVKACLGILSQSYKNSDYGNTIYKLSVTEIYHMAKYLQNEEEVTEILIIDLLENLSSDSVNPEISAISRKILTHWLDSSKRLNQIIPQNILS